MEPTTKKTPKKTLVKLPFSDMAAWGVRGSYKQSTMDFQGDALRVTYPAKKFGGGSVANFDASPKGLPARHVALMYTVTFESDFDWVKGGKLPGVFIGSGKGGAGKVFSKDAASVRMMWRRDGDAEAYVYLPKGAPEMPKVEGMVRGNGHGDSLWRGVVAFKKNAPNTVRIEVKVNAPGKSDGVLTVTVNDKTCTVQGVTFSLDPKNVVSGIGFVTFFGGDDGTWAPSKACHAMFRDVALEILG